MFLKNKNIIFKTRRSKVTDYAALKYLNLALICMHDLTRESIAAVTDHFADAFVRENVARVYMTL